MTEGISVGDAAGIRPLAIKTHYRCPKCGFKIVDSEVALFKQKRNHHRRYHQSRELTKIRLGGGKLETSST